MSTISEELQTIRDKRNGISRSQLYGNRGHFPIPQLISSSSSKKANNLANLADMLKKF